MPIPIVNNTDTHLPFSGSDLLGPALLETQHAKRLLHRAHQVFAVREQRMMGVLSRRQPRIHQPAAAHRRRHVQMQRRRDRLRRTRLRERGLSLLRRTARRPALELLLHLGSALLEHCIAFERLRGAIAFGAAVYDLDATLLLLLLLL